MAKRHGIFGPPGTGKTTEIIRRIGVAIEHGINPGRIGLTSFTKAGAQELANRANINTKWAGTTHSFCFRLAQLTKEQVVGREDYKILSELTGLEITGQDPDSDIMELSQGDIYLAYQQLATAKMISYEQLWSGCPQVGTRNDFLYFCATYDKYKKQKFMVDFNDMLRLALDRPAPDIDVLFADEAQDFSPLQWEVIEHWTNNIHYTQVAGDDDQAIYVWGGADAHGMDDWSKRHDADIRTLGQSYRVPRKVHALASNLISKVSRRVDKQYLPRDQEGSLKFVGSHTQIKAPQHGEEWLIIYRNHSLRKEIESWLIENNVPYICDNGKPGLIHGWTGRSAKIWIKYQSGERLSYAEERTLKRGLDYHWKPRFERGDIDKSKHFWQVLRGSDNELYYLRKIHEQHGLGSVKPTIHLTSMHGSKGREADNVILLNAMNPRTAESYNQDPDSEIRTFYVGITRSKNNLWVIEGEEPLPELRP